MIPALALGAFGLIFLGLALYLLVLAIAAFASPPPGVIQPNSATRVAVLIPAHNEQALIGLSVESLLNQSYPRDRYRVFVIADNCEDETARVASSAGAEVLVRDDRGATGKGHALRWAFDRLLLDRDFAAFVVVDADSIADAEMLTQLVAAFQAGSDVVQAEYLILPDGTSLRTRLAEISFLLFHRVRLGGRAALGMPSNLVGNGMLLSRRILTERPWNAFSAVEDLEYSLDLREAGVRPGFARHARVWGPVAPSYRAGAGQRVRWEGGRLHLAIHRIPRLVRAAVIRRDPGALDAALDLAVPPLAAFALLIGSGALLSLIAAEIRIGPAWMVWIWLAAGAALAGFVLVGLRAAGAPVALYLVLFEAPRFLAWKLLAYVQIVSGFDPNRWDRAHRTGSEPQSPSVEIAGVRIDALDMDGAVSRIRQALRTRKFMQVATVNLDFLVRAQTNVELRKTFQRSELNLPDGTPVVWLGRLLGRRMPGRVAGADLVPILAREAADVGASVFLLGGEHGVARQAGDRLLAENPSLQIAGWLEPPRASLDDMDHDSILAAIGAARPDILLVALGNPKQDLWIDRHRDRLPVTVAIGVGCVFEILAGRHHRAPEWMQSAGLEWLHRLREEPRRLLRRYSADLSWLPVLTVKVLYQRIQSGLRTA